METAQELEKRVKEQTNETKVLESKFNDLMGQFPVMDILKKNEKLKYRIRILERAIEQKRIGLDPVYETPIASIKSLFDQIIRQKFELNEVKVNIEKGRDTDFQCSCSFALAKRLKMDPTLVANVIADRLRTLANGSFVDGESVSVKGKGFVAFNLSKSRI
ncbi:hypothetical protein ACOME3_000898 [Neoechinorhynchus agilis]